MLRSQDKRKDHAYVVYEKRDEELYLTIILTKNVVPRFVENTIRKHFLESGWSNKTRDEHEAFEDFMADVSYFEMDLEAAKKIVNIEDECKDTNRNLLFMICRQFEKATPIVYRRQTQHKKT